MCVLACVKMLRMRHEMRCVFNAFLSFWLTIDVYVCISFPLAWLVGRLVGRLVYRGFGAYI